MEDITLGDYYVAFIVLVILGIQSSSLRRTRAPIERGLLSALSAGYVTRDYASTGARLSFVWSLGFQRRRSVRLARNPLINGRNPIRGSG